MFVRRFLFLGALLMCTGCVAYGPVAGGYGYDPGYGVGSYNPAPFYTPPPPTYYRPPVYIPAPPVYYRPPVYVSPAPRVVVPIFIAPPAVHFPQYRPYRHHHHRPGWRG